MANAVTDDTLMDWGPRGWLPSCTPLEELPQIEEARTKVAGLVVWQDLERLPTLPSQRERHPGPLGLRVASHQLASLPSDLGPLALEVVGAVDEPELRRLERLEIAYFMGDARSEAVVYRSGVLSSTVGVAVSNGCGDDDLRALLAGARGLRALAASSSRLTDAAFAQLPPTLEALSVGAHTTHAVHPSLARCQRLRRVTLASTAGLAPLATLRELERVVVSSPDDDGAGLGALAGSRLRELWLGEGTQDVALAHLASLPCLEAFGCPNSWVSAEGARLLSGAPRLRFLDLSVVTLDDAALEIVGGLASLEVLHLRDSRLRSLDALRGLSRLRALDLSYTTVDDVALAALEGISSLQEVVLFGARTTEAGRRALRDALPRARVVPSP